MAKVSLRIYNQEIENLVERGQLDEAIAHCRHVLNTFPKNLETYRLIGKAYLEAKRYTEATDIFERLLMAVPDDFVAHVGMSIIHDEQNDMDAAIWYMQRAFEVQPSNAAIQGELQRLYGRRDGVEPPKIRLTRGALAQMYVQGELYPQAISEINSVLEEDRDRHDMQVLLARAYFHAGQKNEAAEICSQLLRRYPYCLDGNRVLVELLPETEQGESVQAYRKRVNEMDPYAAYATGSVFRSDEVPDAAVSLDRLEWDGQSVDMGPEWGESLGIRRDEGAAASGEDPDWLKAGLTPESPAVSFPTEQPVSAAGGEDEIPEFLREAGWGEDTGTFKEGPGTFDTLNESSEEPAIAAGDLPDWVKAMAPAEADVESAAPQQSEPGEDLTQDDVPDWLQGLGDVQSPPRVEQPLTTGDDMPEWLESMKPTEDTASQPDELPMASAADDENVPDWLKSTQPEEKQAMPEDAPQEPSQEISPAEEAPLSDWQLDAEAPASPVDAGRADLGSLGASADEQDDAIAWLEGLASKHGAKPEELVTDPEARTETEPDWVQQVKEAGAEEAPIAAEEPVEEVDFPVDLPDISAEEGAGPSGEPDVAFAFDSTDTGDLGASSEEQDDAVAWLEGLASKHGAKPEELVTDPEARKETAPDWVQKASEAGAAQSSTDEPPTQPPAEDSEPQIHVVEEPVSSADADETGMWLRDLGEEAGFAEEPAAQPETKEDITDWLSGLEAEEAEQTAAPQAEAAPEPARETALEPPDWLRSMETDSSSADTEKAPAEEAATEDLPFWLAGLEGEADGIAAEPAVAAGDDLPDWLRAEAEMEQGSVLPEEPTSPTDWRPADAAEEPAPSEEPPAPPLAPIAEEQPAPIPPPPAPVETRPEPAPPAPPEREAYREPVTRSRSGMTGMLSAAQDPALTQAQNELTRGNIPGAMDNYSKLIKKGKMLDEIIFDLREALYRYPVEVGILQTLGDAYMRGNRLQEALDSYTKAEELLR